MFGQQGTRNDLQSITTVAIHHSDNSVINQFTNVYSSKYGRHPCVSHPHGDADGTVHVALIQPAMFGDATFLGSKGGRILHETNTVKQCNTY